MDMSKFNDGRVMDPSITLAHSSRCNRDSVCIKTGIEITTEDERKIFIRKNNITDIHYYSDMLQTSA